MLTRKEYWSEVSAIAERVAEKYRDQRRAGDRPDLTDIVHSHVDGHQYTIYTGQAIAVLFHSTDHTVIDEHGVPDTINEAIAHAAYYALRSDVEERIAYVLPDLEDEEDEEDEEGEEGEA